MFEFFNIILVYPISNLLLFFNYIFSSLHFPFAFGFSIVGLTVLIRLVLHPLVHRQIALSKKMEQVKPHMDRLSKEHKEDKKKLQEEQMKLYKELGINPASGCLLALVQLPIFIALYRVLSHFVSNGTELAKVVPLINKIAYAPFLKVTTLDPNFFGLSLWAMPNQYQKVGWVYLLIPVVTAILQYFQVVVSSPPVPPKKADNSKEAPNSQDDMQRMMSVQMRYILPLMIGYFSFSLPFGLSLYWNIFSLMTIAQYMWYHKHHSIKK